MALYRDIKFRAKKGILIIIKSGVMEVGGGLEKAKKEDRTQCFIQFCFETGFRKDIVPFGINYFGSCTWLIISTAFKISVKQTYFAHTHPPFKICLLSPLPGL